MSRSFKSTLRTKNDIYLGKHDWNHLFRIMEKANLRSFHFTSNDTPPICSGCDVCDAMPDYARCEGYMSIIKYDVESRHGSKMRYAGRRKIRK